MRLLLICLLSLGLAPAANADIAAPTGRVILTLGGDLPFGNAPGATGDDQNHSGYLGLEYATGAAFDDTMLGAMPQHQVSATLPGSGEMAYSGPRLTDLMSAVGSTGKSALPLALDGYQAQITWDHMTTYQPIVATHADGIPLPVGKRGPTMIVYPPVDDKQLYESFDALQVWAMFFIGVE